MKRQPPKVAKSFEGSASQFLRRGGIQGVVGIRVSFHTHGSMDSLSVWGSMQGRAQEGIRNTQHTCAQDESVPIGACQNDSKAHSR